MAGEEIVFTAGRLYRVDRQGSVRWSLFSEGSLRCIQNGDWVSSQLLEDCFQNDLGEHVILPGQILYDVKVIHTTQLLERGLPSHAEKCLDRNEGAGHESAAEVVALSKRQVFLNGFVE